jgi:hypothetical protein
MGRVQLGQQLGRAGQQVQLDQQQQRVAVELLVMASCSKLLAA